MANKQHPPINAADFRKYVKDAEKTAHSRVHTGKPKEPVEPVPVPEPELIDPPMTGEPDSYRLIDDPEPVRDQPVIHDTPDAEYPAEYPDNGLSELDDPFDRLAEDPMDEDPA